MLLADDHALVRLGCRTLLGDGHGFEIAGEASDGNEAFTIAKDVRPDIVLMDIKMPRLNGIEATRRIKKELPRTRVLGFSMYADQAYVRETLRAGAAGYVVKESRPEELLTAVQAVAAGQGFLSPAVSETVFRDYRKHVTDPIDLLSGREREILQLLAEGSTNKEIAQALNISVYTVDAHRGRIMEKLDVSSIGGLVRFAMRSGIVD